MSKKVTISIVSVILVAAVAVGLVLFAKNYDNGKPSGDTPDSKVQYLDEDRSGEEFIVDEEEKTTKETQYVDEFIPSDDSLSDNSIDVATTNFTIERIVDHATNEEVTGRVVFGKGFNASENYIKFDAKGNFEIFLTGYLEQTMKGKYSEYEDIIYVEFEDGTAAEYDVKYTDNGIISYIVVNYGDYDIYFS